MLLAFESVVAAWLVIGLPVLGALRYRRLAATIEHDPSMRLRFYRRSMARQWSLGAVTLAVVLAGGWSFSRLGLVPHWRREVALLPLVGELIAAALAVVVVLRWQHRRRPDRSWVERLLRQVRAILPRTPHERRLFAGVAVTAGLVEEFLYRGFLTAWVLHVLPGVGWSGALLLSSAAFGVAHAYQGVPGVLGTGVVGFAFASIYAVTGSLYVPMLLHTLVDLRVLLLVPRQVRASGTASDPASP